MITAPSPSQPPASAVGIFALRAQVAAQAEEAGGDEQGQCAGDVDGHLQEGGPAAAVIAGVDERLPEREKGQGREREVNDPRRPGYAVPCVWRRDASCSASIQSQRRESGCGFFFFLAFAGDCSLGPWDCWDQWLACLLSPDSCLLINR